jgi:hypothetical protein
MPYIPNAPWSAKTGYLCACTRVLDTMVFLRDTEH